MKKKDEKILLIDGPLFEEVQRSWIFPDCKTFVDCIPKYDPETITKNYLARCNYPDFDLNVFLESHFVCPLHISTFCPDYYLSMKEHIESLWTTLTQSPDQLQSPHSTLIPLPHPYIVPGGRFREIYYWDSYFTSEGLACSGNLEMILNMARNFTYLIDTIGHVPNGNRIYYRSRSQPPYFSCILNIIEQHLGFEAVKPFISALEKEYQFWMDGSEKLTSQIRAFRRVIKMKNDSILNRYWDDDPRPRPESFREDTRLFEKVDEATKPHLFRNIRATCESGWDFSSRWLRNPQDFSSIYTTELIPIDLNALIYHMECKLAHFYAQLGASDKSEQYAIAAEKRNKALHRYCWNKQKGFYFDYCWTEEKQSSAKTLAATTPLFFKMSTLQQAQAVAKVLGEKFLASGGLITTLVETGQQWDKPNGWPPLHWITIRGLMHYNMNYLANEIAQRWLNLNCKVFNQTRKMLEKYNVCDVSLEGGGGEYPLQDGFGWTNAIVLALMKQFNIV